MAITKPASRVCTAIGTVAIHFHTRAAGAPVLGGINVERLDANGEQIDVVPGAFTDLSPAQQSDEKAILDAIRAYAINNLMGVV
jgi:hypothetical protein